MWRVVHSSALALCTPGKVLSCSSVCYTAWFSILDMLSALAVLLAEFTAVLLDFLVPLYCIPVYSYSFTSRDKVNMAFVLRFSSSVIANTLAYQRELTLKKQNQALLLVAKNLFSQLSDLTVLLKEIMSEARNITNAERWVGECGGQVSRENCPSLENMHGW